MTSLLAWLRQEPSGITNHMMRDDQIRNGHYTHLEPMDARYATSYRSIEEALATAFPASQIWQIYGEGWVAYRTGVDLAGIVV